MFLAIDTNTLIIISIILLVILIILCGILIFVFIKRKNTNANNLNTNELTNIIDLQIKNVIKDEMLNILKNNNENKDNILKILQSNFEGFNNKLIDNINTNNKTLNNVKESVGRIDESSKNLSRLNEEINELNKVFNNNQIRGKFGEIQLETILSNIFGEANGLYKTQYEVKNNDGEKVRPDAVIFIDNNTILCIDSKFSFTEFNKIFEKDPRKIENTELTTLKSRLVEQVKKIHDNYIIKNKTYMYALMFIPSDSIFNFIQCNDYLYKNVIEFATKNDVIICCPSTIQPVLANIKYFKINLEIHENIDKVILEIKKVSDTSKKLKEKWVSFDKAFEILSNKRQELNGPINKITNYSENALNIGKKENLITNEQLNQVKDDEE